MDAAVRGWWETCARRGWGREIEARRANHYCLRGQENGRIIKTKWGLVIADDTRHSCPKGERE